MDLQNRHRASGVASAPLRIVLPRDRGKRGYTISEAAGQDRRKAASVRETGGVDSRRIHAELGLKMGQQLADK
jgi:hypothetical protein